MIEPETWVRWFKHALVGLALAGFGQVSHTPALAMVGWVALIGLGHLYLQRSVVLVPRDRIVGVLAFLPFPILLWIISLLIGVFT